MKKYIKFILLFIGWMVLCTWYYRALLLFLLLWFCRKPIQERVTNRWVWRTMLALPLVACLWTMPRYRWDTNDRVRLIYQTQKGSPMLPPVHHYIANVLVPEEVAMNLCVWGCRLMPATTVRYFYKGISANLLNQFKKDDREGKMSLFYKPYDNLNWSGNYVMSGVVTQACNSIIGSHQQSVYVIRPKNFDPKKEYPVVFFCHGLLGNWQLYSGLLMNLEDCIVMCLGTEDMSGFFTKADLNAIFSRQIPFLEQLGYKVNHSQLHLMGLSNGGSAVNRAYASFGNKFRSITFISTNVDHTEPTPARILVIAGGRDHCAPGVTGIVKKMKANGVDARILFEPEETHFMLVTRQEDCIRFLNENIRP